MKLNIASSEEKQGQWFDIGFRGKWDLIGMTKHPVIQMKSIVIVFAWGKF